MNILPLKMSFAFTKAITPARQSTGGKVSNLHNGLWKAH